MLQISNSGSGLLTADRHSRKITLISIPFLSVPSPSPTKKSLGRTKQERRSVLSRDSFLFHKCHLYFVPRISNEQTELVFMTHKTEARFALEMPSVRKGRPVTGGGGEVGRQEALFRLKGLKHDVSQPEKNSTVLCVMITAWHPKAGIPQVCTQQHSFCCW